MIVYHGSNMEVPLPDIKHSRKRVDFGPGFYVTPLEIQAKNWSKQYLRRKQNGIISVYDFDIRAYEEADTLQFDSYSEQWLDFVFSCRRGLDTSDFEIVTGGVANDKVFDTVELYFDGIISKNDALGRLIYEKPNMQICFRTQEVIKQYLHFERSYRL